MTGRPVTARTTTLRPVIGRARTVSTPTGAAP